MRLNFKEGAGMKFKLSVLVVLCLAISSLSQFSYADEKKSKFRRQVSNLKSARKATVVIWPHYFGHVSRGELQRYEEKNLLLIRVDGCNFSNKKDADINDLLKLLKKNNIDSSDSNYLPYADLAIYLNYPGGEEGRILLGRRYPGESYVDGEMSLPPYYQPTMLRIDREIYRDIYNWIAASSKWEFFPEPEGYERNDFFENYENRCKEIMNSDYYRNSKQQSCSSSEDSRRTLPSDECPSGWSPPMQGLTPAK